MTSVSANTNSGDRHIILRKLYHEKSELERDLTIKELEIAETIAAWTPTFDQVEIEPKPVPRPSSSLTNISGLTRHSSREEIVPSTSISAKDKSLDQLVFEILQEEKLQLAGLVAVVMKSGFKTTAMKFRNSISQSLLRLKHVHAVNQDKKTKEYSSVKNVGWPKVQERISIRSREQRQKSKMP